MGAEQNHLCPVISYSAPGPRRPIGRADVVFARTSLPPWRSVMAMPQSAPVFPAAGNEARVVRGGGEARDPLVGDLRHAPEHRDGGVGHRDRTAMAGLDAAHDEHHGGPRRMRAGPLLAPGQRMDAAPDRKLHQVVPSGMELDLVDAVAVAVVRAQDRRVLVGEAPPFEGLAPGRPAQRDEAILGEGAPLTPDGFDERTVLGIEIVSAQAAEAGWERASASTLRRHRAAASRTPAGRPAAGA